MDFLLTLTLTTSFVLIVRKPLKRHPSVFYLLALALTTFYVCASIFGVSVYLWRYLLFAQQRCLIALALFTLVMFVAVFPPESRAYVLLHPLRRELSIIGCVLASGHIVVYLRAFAPRLASDMARIAPNISLSLAVSLVLTLLLVTLTVTSFVVVRNRISPTFWKRIQSLAYPFYLLILLHLVLVLLPSALRGSMGITLNLIVYATLFCTYAVLRLRRRHADRRVRLGASPDGC
jgi:DMSO/TMAO reductase YedYZ heme-binding membrane subunit